MKRSYWIFTVATLAAVVLLAAYIYKNAGTFRSILEVSPINIIVFILLQLAVLIINACIQMSYMRHFRLRLPFFDSFGLYAVNTFFNNVFVKGGVIARGYFLKKIHKFDYSSLFLMLVSFSIIQLLCAGVIGIVVTATMFKSKGVFNIFLLLGFIIAVLVSVLLMKVSPKSLFKGRKHWIFGKLEQLSDSWQRISRDKGFVAVLFGLAILEYLAYAFRLSYGFGVLFEKIGFQEALLMSVVAIVSNMLGFTPAALGIREFFTGAAYALVGGNVAQAVAVMVLDRIIATVFIFFVGGLFILYFFNKAAFLFRGEK